MSAPEEGVDNARHHGWSWQVRGPSAPKGSRGGVSDKLTHDLANETTDPGQKRSVMAFSENSIPGGMPLTTAGSSLLEPLSGGVGVLDLSGESGKPNAHLDGCRCDAPR